MEKIDALEDKLKNAWYDIKEGKEYSYIQAKYGLQYHVVSDLKNIDNIENIKLKLESIKEEMAKCETLAKLAKKYEYGNAIVTYIAKELGYKSGKAEAEKIRKADIMRIENIWREYKYGMHIDDIACKYHINNEEVKIIVKRFERRLTSYVAMIREAGDKEAEKRRLKQKFPISDDVIDYIVDGKPINQNEEKIENKGELERDEL